MMLTRERYERARRFVAEQGRPLEVARLRVAFDGAPASAVWDELRTFRNADGGFGHGMEPDLQAPESSVLATSVALQVVRETRRATGTPPPAELVAPAIDYLLATLDRDRNTWRIVPPAADTSPHAPWWTQAGHEEAFAPWSFNPTAECLGYLYEYPASVPPDLLSDLSAMVLAALAGRETVVMHDFLCCKRWAETPGLPPDVRACLLGELDRLLDGVVSRDPAAWPTYVLRPVQVAESPESPFYPALQDVIPANLDWEIAQQEADGSWAPNWSWDGLYPEAWARARVAWAGWITVERLLVLERYGRIAPST